MVKITILSIIFVTFFWGCSSRVIQKTEKPAGKEYASAGLNKKKAMEHFIQGTLADQKGEYAMALLEYQDALKFDPKSGIYYAIAKDHFLLNRLSDALKNINSAINMDSLNTDYFDLLANIHMSAQQNDSASAAYEKILELDSGKINAYYNLGLIYEKSKPLQAIDVYNKLTSIIGPEWNVLIRKAELYERIGKFDEAVKSVEELLALDPSNTNLQRLVIESYIKAEKFELALAKINEALQQYPEDISFLEVKAQVLLQQNKWFEASEAYMLIINKPDIPVDVKIKIGSAYLAQSIRDTALLKVAKDIFTRLDKDTTFWQIKLMLGEISLIEKDDTTAVGYFNKAIDMARWNADAWVRLGGLYFDNRRYEDAENLLKEAVSEFPDNFAVNLILGLALSQMNKFSDAGKYLKKAIELNSKDVTALSAYGFTLNQLKSYDEAVFYLNEALKISPNNVELLGTLGLIYNSQKKWNECDSTYQRALDIDPSNALVLNNYAYALADRGIKLDKALEMAEKAVQKDSANPSYLDTIGWVFYQLKNYDKAEDYINKALVYDKNNATIIEHLGDIKFRKGNKDDAIGLWQKALDLDSENHDLKLKLEKGEL